MALNFPDSPTLNQVYTDTTSGFSYQWDGTVWQSYTAASTKDILILDDISGTFNNSTQTFAITSSGSPVPLISAQQLQINLGGVIQSPGVDYTVSGSNITFTTAPESGLSFSGISIGAAIPLASIIDGSVTPPKLSTGGPSWNTSGGFIVSGITTLGYSSGVGTVRIGSGSTTLIVEGDAKVTGILTVGTSSITLDGVNNTINVGTGLTLSSGGIQAGIVTATAFVGNGSGLTGAGSTVADDTTTNGTFYPVFTQTTSGTITASKVSTSKLSFNPSTGTLNVSNVSIAGTLTYEDVTNIDSIGIVTARSGIVLGPTANTIQLGTGTTISSPSSNTFTLSTNGSERVRVSSAGSFGIGTANPSYRFTVVDNSTGVQGRFESSSSNGTSFGFVNTATNGRTYRIGSNFVTGNGEFAIYDDTAGTNRVFIDSSGRFGVGTNSPNSNLHIEQNQAGNTSILLNNPSTAAGSYSTFTITTGAVSSQIYTDAQGNDGLQGLTIRTTTNHAMRLGTNNTERARISAAGGFSVGTTADPGAGAIYATGDITAFYSSDIRLKKDIEPISEPIKKLMEISGVTYKWNEEYLKDKEVDGYFVRETEVGVIAQEVEKVLPEVVATRENGYKAVRYEKLVALLIEAVKDQQKQIDELRTKLEEK